jgi:hypothetical protein
MEATPPKRRFQFKLRTLLLLIVAISLALAAMKFATAGWANAVVNLTMFALLFSVVLALCRRPFWIGFAACGIGYLVLVESHFASDFVDRLTTTKSVDFLREVFHPERDYFPRGYLSVIAPDESEDEIHRREQWDTMASNFRLIVTCFWVLILGMLGGMLAQFAAGRAAASGSGRGS